MMEVATRTGSLNSLSTPPMHTHILRPAERQVLAAWSAAHLGLAWSLSGDGFHPLESRENMPFPASLFSAVVLST